MHRRTSLLSADGGLRVRLSGARAAAAGRARSDGVDLDLARGGDRGAGRRVRLRQDHAGAHAARPGRSRPDAGRVLFDGQPLPYLDAGACEAYRRHVQLVLQDPTGALNPRHTVYEAVAEGLRIHRSPRRRRANVVARRLSQAGLRPPERFLPALPARAVRRPAAAGGDRRRAGAGPRAAGRRRAGGLAGRLGARRDPGAAAATARRAGLSALVVTHDLGLAWNIADRVAVMYLGRIVETGPVEDVLTAPQHPYTQGAAVGRAGVRRRAGGPAPASRRTRPRSRPAAASTRAARCWPPARPSGWASPTAAGRWIPRRCPPRGRHAACHAAAPPEQPPE